MQPTLPADDWPTLGGGVRRVNAQAAKLTPACRELWSNTLPVCSLAAPIALRGRLILGDNQGGVQSWDLLSGRTGLVYDTLGSPCVGLSGAGTAILCAQQDGGVYALDANRNVHIWRQKLPGALNSPPCFTPWGVFAVDDKGSLYELDRISGSPKLLLEGTGPCSGGLLPLRQGLVWLCGKELKSHDPRAAQPLWPVRELEFESRAALCCNEQYIFVLGFEGGLCALDIASGRLIWSAELPGQFAGAPASGPTGIICASLAGRVFCVNPKDGGIKWQKTAGSVVSSSPALSAGHAVLGLGSGKVVLLDLETGQKAAEYALKSPQHTQPVIWRGILVALGLGGEVAAWSSETEG